MSVFTNIDELSATSEEEIRRKQVISKFGSCVKLDILSYTFISSPNEAAMALRKPSASIKKALAPKAKASSKEEAQARGRRRFG